MATAARPTPASGSTPTPEEYATQALLSAGLDELAPFARTLHAKVTAAIEGAVHDENRACQQIAEYEGADRVALRIRLRRVLWPDPGARR